jgi:hypothetical protein
MFPDILYELHHGIDRDARVNDEGRRKPHTGADRHEALLAPAKVRVQARVGDGPRSDVSPSVSVGLGARDLVPGEVAARSRLRFDHDRLAPNLGKLIGDYACGNVSDPTRWKRQDYVDAPARKVGLHICRGCGQLLMYRYFRNSILIDLLPELFPPGFRERERPQA